MPSNSNDGTETSLRNIVTLLSGGSGEIVSSSNDSTEESLRKVVTLLGNGVGGTGNTAPLVGVQWTTRHTNSTGNPYVIGSIVYHNGRVYRCTATNDSIEPGGSGNPYWADLGVGSLLPNENPKIEGGSINTSDSGGSINTSNGGGSINTAGSVNDSGDSFGGGLINTSASLFAYGGYINTSAHEGGAGGNIDTRGEGANGWMGGSIITKATEGGAGGSINTSGGDEGAGGSINTSGGSEGVGGSINTSNGGGSINTTGGDAGSGGSINTSAGDSDGGGYIHTYGEDGVGGNIDTHGEEVAGGYIYTFASGSSTGGYINTSGATGTGGNIDTSNGGGSINTRGTGSIELGVTGTRTTLNGSASGSNKTITLPNATGTIALQNSFTIAVPNVDIGKTVASNPLGWSQQVTIPTNIAELTGGLPCILDSVAIQITNRLGTGQLHTSLTYVGGVRVGSQSILALTPVNGVGSYGADDYFTTTTTNTRPWVGGYTKAFTSGGTFGRSLYNGGAIFLNNAVNSGTFRTAYWETPLTEAMDATQTTLLQNNYISGAPSFEGSYLKIDDEVVLITSWPTASGARPTILRAQLGTTATTHAVGAPVTTNLGAALGGGILATVYLNFIRVG